MKLVPVCEFQFRDYNGTSTNGKDMPDHAYLTCKNHPDLRWLTKNPYQRTIHYLGLADGVVLTEENAKYAWQECDCTFHDLMVIVKEEEFFCGDKDCSCGEEQKSE